MAKSACFEENDGIIGRLDVAMVSLHATLRVLCHVVSDITVSECRERCRCLWSIKDVIVAGFVQYGKVEVWQRVCDEGWKRG